VRVLITDGIRYARETPERFDLILVDGPDPIEPQAAGASLYSSEFYQLCKGLLNPGGTFVIQSDVPFHNPEAMRLTYGALQEVFRTVQAYTAPVPSYLGGVMCFVLASDGGPEVSAPRRANMPEAAITGLGYYTPEIHTAAFQLPPYIATLTVRASSAEDLRAQTEIA
jgi:spermidine synthase